MSNYELTYIVRPLEEANLTATNERIVKVVQNAGGEILSRNDWGRRRLAYPIRKNNDAFYTTLYITLPGTAVRGVERSLQLIDDVLRYLVVHVETHTIPSAPAPAPAAEVPAAVPTQAESAPAADAAVSAAETPAAGAAPAVTGAAEAPQAATETVPTA